MNTGEIIKSLREAKGITQSELAEAIGYTNRTTIAKIEANCVDLPAKKIQAFAKFFNVKPSYILGLTTEPLPTMDLSAQAEYNALNLTDRMIIDKLIHALYLASR